MIGCDGVQRLDERNRSCRPLEMIPMLQPNKFSLSLILSLASSAFAGIACSGGDEDTRSAAEAEGNGGAIQSVTTARSVGGSSGSSGAASSVRSTGGTRNDASTRTSSEAAGGTGTQGGASSGSASSSDGPRGGTRASALSSQTMTQGDGGTPNATTKSSGGASTKATGGSGVASGGTQASSTKAAGGAAGQTSGIPSTSTFPVGTGKPTVYVAGDSTAQTYTSSSDGRQGWGQRIAEFFTTDVVFVNKAIGGRSSKSFIDEGRLDEILSLIKQGDYLFAQWGINDRYQSEPARYTDPATTFRTYLKQYIDGARKKNAIPVLLTPTPRHQYVNGVFENGFAAYCDAIKAVGKETNTPVIDVQTEALAYYTSIGDAEVTSSIMVDVLHFKPEGAYQMARIVADGVHDSILPIARFAIESKL